jgi:hypothetical protein
VLWIRIRIDLVVLWIRIENAEPDPGEWMLTKINKKTPVFLPFKKTFLLS